jgi:hypothetical protein
MKVVKIILSVYSWAAIGTLIVFLWRVAYFYAKTSGQRVGYYFLLLPTLLLVAGVAWYLRYSGDFTGQPAGDLLLFGVRGVAALAPQLAYPILLEPWFALASFHVPLAIGVTLDLALVWYYWGWTLKEKVE